MKCDFWSFSAM